MDALTPEVIFALTAYIGRLLSSASAADVLTWYVTRLVHRVPPEHRERIGPADGLPVTAEEAVARLFLAQMGSPDTRVRWRAAHGVRRLARTGEQGSVAAFVAQHGRQKELAFAGPAPAYYPMAARQWAVITLDRIAAECPHAVVAGGRLLLQAALDDAFPHLLVRAFARDACRKLITAGVLAVSPVERDGLEQVNQSSLPRKKAERSGGGNWFGHNGEGRRFRFDALDTLPNWYDRLLRSFAGLSQEVLLDTAERWIVDAWGWDQSAVVSAQDLPLRFRHGGWALTQHRHGSEPTVERLNTHLEWHAMWCAAGELLKSVPLAEAEPDDWDDLASRIRRNQLCDPPLWPADLLVPMPLHVRHWVLGDSPLEDWVASITEADHRVALLTPEHAGYVVVAGHEQTIVCDRSQTVHVSSALVEPSTASALLRALQSMDDSWDFKLPEEGEDQFEFCEPPYKLLGWLCSLHRDQGIDGKDPYSGHARYVEVLPGRRVCSAFGLVRDASGAPRWSRSAATAPMFVYEVWGEGDDDDKSFFERKSTGYRLLAHRAQLQEFLCCEALDLIAEVEVTRRGHKTKSRFGPEDAETPKGKSDRIYRLDRQGGLYLAEGHHGTWAGAGPQPATGCQGRDA